MIKFSLLENAIDSIEYGLEYFEKAEKEKVTKYYKYAILSLFQGTELLLKELISHENIIYIFDKNSLFRNCNDPFSPKLDELYNCKSIDIKEICITIKKFYPNYFDNNSIKIIEKIAKERNKIQHFAIDINTNEIKENLTLLYGKVIKPSFEYLNDNNKSIKNIFDDKIEEIFGYHKNADLEEKILRTKNINYGRGCCYNCSNYSLFVINEAQNLYKEFYCTSCPINLKEIDETKIRECPECYCNSLLYYDETFQGICLNTHCANNRDGGVLIEMYPCEVCNDYVIEGKCLCTE